MKQRQRFLRYLFLLTSMFSFGGIIFSQDNTMTNVSIFRDPTELHILIVPPDDSEGVDVRSLTLIPPEDTDNEEYTLQDLFGSAIDLDSVKDPLCLGVSQSGVISWVLSNWPECSSQSIAPPQRIGNKFWVNPRDPNGIVVLDVTWRGEEQICTNTTCSLMFDEPEPVRTEIDATGELQIAQPLTITNQSSGFFTQAKWQFYHRVDTNAEWDEFGRAILNEGEWSFETQGTPPPILADTPNNRAYSLAEADIHIVLNDNQEVVVISLTPKFKGQYAVSLVLGENVASELNPLCLDTPSLDNALLPYVDCEVFDISDVDFETEFVLDSTGSIDKNQTVTVSAIDIGYAYERWIFRQKQVVQEQVLWNQINEYARNQNRSVQEGYLWQPPLPDTNQPEQPFQILFGLRNNLRTNTIDVTYYQPGEYDIVLVSDGLTPITPDKSCEDIKNLPNVHCETISVVDPCPIPDIAINALGTITLGDDIDFTSEVESSNLAGETYTYSWGFGNGETSTEDNPIDVMYSEIGEYMITLDVSYICATNGEMITGSVTHTLVISPPTTPSPTWTPTPTTPSDVGETPEIPEPTPATSDVSETPQVLEASVLPTPIAVGVPQLLEHDPATDSTTDTFKYVWNYLRIPIWTDNEEPRIAALVTTIETDDDMLDRVLKLQPDTPGNLSYILLDYDIDYLETIRLDFNWGILSQPDQDLGLGVMLAVNPDNGSHYLLQFQTGSWNLFACSGLVYLGEQEGTLTFDELCTLLESKSWESANIHGLFQGNYTGEPLHTTVWFDHSAGVTQIWASITSHTNDIQETYHYDTSDGLLEGDDNTRVDSFDDDDNTVLGQVGLVARNLTDSSGSGASILFDDVYLNYESNEIRIAAQPRNDNVSSDRQELAILFLRTSLAYELSTIPSTCSLIEATREDLTKSQNYFESNETYEPITNLIWEMLDITGRNISCPPPENNYLQRTDILCGPIADLFINEQTKLTFQYIDETALFGICR